jgi:hypothetical protein
VSLLKALAMLALLWGILWVGYHIGIWSAPTNATLSGAVGFAALIRTYDRHPTTDSRRGE